MRNSKHTREFRDSAIQLVLNSNEEIKVIAEDLGVNPKTLYNWVYNYKKDNNLTSYQRSNTKISNKESSEEEIGTAIGGAIGMGMLFILWTVSDIILGLFVLFTRPKIIIKTFIISFFDYSCICDKNVTSVKL